MNDSGSKRTFPGGSKRDNADSKPRFELIPFELLERVAVWYGLGAEKYGDNNWRMGQPKSAVLGSLFRHLFKYMRGMEDEDHLAAVIWNALCLMNADTYHSDNPLICDTDDWYDENGVPTGKGSYLQKQKEEEIVEEDIFPYHISLKDIEDIARGENYNPRNEV